VYELRSISGAEMSKTLWHWCRSVSQTLWNWCRSVSDFTMVPKCPMDTSAPVPKCLVSEVS